eukprot:12833283-Heterocapsa_arctica.AAC.1
MPLPRVRASRPPLGRPGHSVIGRCLGRGPSVGAGSGVGLASRPSSRPPAALAPAATRSSAWLPGL